MRGSSCAAGDCRRATLSVAVQRASAAIVWIRQRVVRYLAPRILLVRMLDSFRYRQSIMDAPNKMRAARIVGPEKFAVESVVRPDPRPGQLRFRVEGSGVCASNLGPWFGLPWTQYPLGPG